MSIDRWKNSSLKTGLGVRHHPTETMIRALLSSAYCRLYRPITPGMTVLDIGTFHTNNLAPFQERDCACHGVEINADMLAIAESGAARHGVDAALAIGTNRSLPYADGFFDLLLSINTVHYEENWDNMNGALAEFARVLKPGGRAFIMTMGANHFLRASAAQLDTHRIQIMENDFRKGTVMTVFNDSDHLTTTLRTSFSDVEGGSATETFPLKSHHFIWALAQK